MAFVVRVKGQRRLGGYKTGMSPDDADLELYQLSICILQYRVAARVIKCGRLRYRGM